MPNVWLVCLSEDAGGAEHHVLDLARALPETIEVTVVSTAGGWLEHASRDAGLATRVVSVPRGNLDLRVLRGLRGLLRSGPPDIMHSHLGRSDWYCWLASFGVPGVHLVSTEHGISANRPELYGGAMRRAFHRVGHRARLRRTVATIAVSEYTAEALLARYPSLGRKRPIVIRPGVRVEEYLEARAERPLSPGSLRLASVGRLSLEKGMDIVVEAVRRAVESGADVTLAIAGEGPERSRLAGMVNESGLGPRVRLLGHVDRVVDVLRGADVFVLASRSENMPLVLLECLAAGVPVVTADVGGVREVVTEGVTGVLVAPADARLLAEMLFGLWKEPSAVTALSLGAMSASVDIDVKVMADSTMGVYRRAISG
jgi:glycogen(starch) synthase